MTIQEKLISVLILGMLITTHVSAQTNKPMIHKGSTLISSIDPNICHQDGTAVGGYDVVSYRQPDGPQMGSSTYTVEHHGLSYLFINEANRHTFQEQPEKYIPAYGGFCATTIALGLPTCPDYSNFKIEDDRLLLFETTGFTNGRTLWDSNPRIFRTKADTNFDKLGDRN